MIGDVNDDWRDYNDNNGWIILLAVVAILTLLFI